MIRQCRQCSASFEITDDDLKFYEKVSPIFGGKKYLIPAPTFCSDCRLRRRLSFRNLKNLYIRKCDATGETIISIYRPDSPYKVYKSSIIHSDKFNPLEYGMEFDFNRTFSEQFHELDLKVPRAHSNVILDTLINSDYVNGAHTCKNCYLITNTTHNENTYYGETLYGTNNSMDCFNVTGSDICYECVDSQILYNCFWCRNCMNSRELYYCINCSSCNNCFGCVNIKNKQYCFFNAQLSEAEYFSQIKNIKYTRSEIKKYKEKLNDLFLSVPHKFANNFSVENCVGDYISNSKKCFNSFFIDKGENLKHCIYLYGGAKDCQDITVWGENIELCYECEAVGANANNVIFCNRTYTNCSDLYYCSSCNPANKNCFGCFGLQRNQYCIFNKQYSKEEYEKLAPRIIEHMKQTGEWGEFFPSNLSNFGYNETQANEIFPLSKEEAVKLGFNWSDYSVNASFVGNFYEPREDISYYSDPKKAQEILGGILKCEITGKVFKIIPQELAFYIKNNIPIPRRCFEQRHLDRLAQRNPMKLWDRKCMKCGKDIKTTYAPERKEIVYCEECYRGEVY